MKSRFLLPVLSLALAQGLFAAPNELTDEEKANGWRLLFDGKTTLGWTALGKQEFPAQGWVVEGGALVHKAKGGGGDIVTNEQFTNFELTWEWKIGPIANEAVD